MKILVTGATGRIGRHLALELIKRGDIVRILVHDKGKLAEDGVLPENLEMVEGDITNIDSLRKAVDGVDMVFHLAAIVDYTATNELMQKVNV
jgi:nucleoside-diphosphate-sugar epimerase